MSPLARDAPAGPLDGVRVIDLTTVLMGPFASQILGDLGADVIKVEPPGGDPNRAIVPARHPGMGGAFLNVNRNKRSICIDLKHPAGVDALMRLARDADVLLYNVRPAAMARLGLTWETLSAINPRLIYVGAFGFGQEGPYAAKPAYDDLIQGVTGLPSLIARVGDGVPRYVPLAFIDRTVGLAAANAVCAALYRREVSGVGQRVDVPMFETMVPFVLAEHLSGRNFVPAEGPIGYSRLLARERTPYATRDGYLCALIYNDKQWRSYCAMIGDPARFGCDPRLKDLGTRTAHIADLYAEVAEVMRTRTTEQWMSAMEAADIPAMPMHTLESLLDDPHLAAIGFFREVDHPTEGRILMMEPPGHWSESPPSVRRHAPLAGEHTRELLAEAGYDPARIEELLGTGAVRAAD